MKLDEKPTDPAHPLLVESKTEKKKEDVAGTFGLQKPSEINPDVVKNDAQDELLRKAEEIRKKRKALELEKIRQEEKAKSADFMKKGALKGGFFNKKKTEKNTEKKPNPGIAKTSAKTSVKSKEKVIDLTNIEKKDNLQIPEVQESIRKTLSDTDSWLTPELAQVFATRPDLLKGLQDPKVQDALQLMQSNPAEAKVKYGGDSEVEKYMKEFSTLMATHFQLLAEKEAKKQKQQTKTQEKTTDIKPVTKKKDDISPESIAAATQGMNLPAGDAEKLKDPKIVEAMMDPGVQRVIEQLKRGVQVDFRTLGRQDPQLATRLHLLVSSGILGVAS